MSSRVPFASGEFLESLSFFTHLMGFREWEPCEPDEFELPFAAVDAPAPAGPCAPARSAPTVKRRQALAIRTATTNNDFFIVTPQSKILGQGWGCGLTNSRPQQVSGSVLPNGPYSPNQSHWPFEQVPSLRSISFWIRKAWLVRNRQVRTLTCEIGLREAYQGHPATAPT